MAGHARPLAFPTATSDRFSFLWCTDLHVSVTGMHVLDRIGRYADRTGAKMIIHSGDLEYFGADDNGYYVAPFWRITGNTQLSVAYERRYAALFVSAPEVTRISWLVTIEHRF